MGWRCYDWKHKDVTELWMFVAVWPVNWIRTLRTFDWSCPIEDCLLQSPKRIHLQHFLMWFQQKRRSDSMFFSAFLAAKGCQYTEYWWGTFIMSSVITAWKFKSCSPENRPKGTQKERFVQTKHFQTIIFPGWAVKLHGCILELRSAGIFASVQKRLNSWNPPPATGGPKKKVRNGGDLIFSGCHRENAPTHLVNLTANCPDDTPTTQNAPSRLRSGRWGLDVLVGWSWWFPTSLQHMGDATHTLILITLIPALQWTNNIRTDGLH